MRIIIAGSRTVSEKDVRDALTCCSWIGFASAIVSGGAQGADEFGERWAEDRSVEVQRYLADWKAYGKRAGPLRNKIMAENAEGLVAVWDGESRGTYSMIELAVAQGLRIAYLRTDTRTMKEIAPTGIFASVWEFAEERAGILEHCGVADKSNAECLAGREALQKFARRGNSSGCC